MHTEFGFQSIYAGFFKSFVGVCKLVNRFSRENLYLMCDVCYEIFHFVIKLLLTFNKKLSKFVRKGSVFVLRILSGRV